MFQLAQPAQAEIEIKKSRFIGLVFPATSRAEARTWLTEVRNRYPGAGHYCWALICEGDSGLDDDGEPAGTAARPMYNVLSHKNVTNVLAVVVRYWGGIKLGAGGLARAYGQAVSDAMKTAELIEQVPMRVLRVALPFSGEAGLRRLCSQHSATVEQADYGDTAVLTLRVPVDLLDTLLRQANDLLRGELKLLDD